MMKISSKPNDKKDSRFHVFNKAYHRQMTERCKKEAYLDMVAAMMKVYRLDPGRENFNVLKEPDNKERKTMQLLELIKPRFGESCGNNLARKSRRSLVQVDHTY